MNTTPYGTAVLERALKTFAQALLAVLGAGSFGLLDAPWLPALSTAGMAAVLSVLTSIAGAGFGPDGPGLVERLPTVRKDTSPAAGE